MVNSNKHTLLFYVYEMNVYNTTFWWNAANENGVNVFGGTLLLYWLYILNDIKRSTLFVYVPHEFWVLLDFSAKKK